MNDFGHSKYRPDNLNACSHGLCSTQAGQPDTIPFRISDSPTLGNFPNRETPMRVWGLAGPQSRPQKRIILIRDSQKSISNWGNSLFSHLLSTFKVCATPTLMAARRWDLPVVIFCSCCGWRNSCAIRYTL